MHSHRMVDIVGDAAFLGEVAAESTRQNRSQSWLIRQCLNAHRTALAEIVVDSEAHQAMKRSPLRDPIRRALLIANLELSESENPEIRELATTPHGTEQRSFFHEERLVEWCDAEADRLGVSTDEIYMWAWNRHIDVIRSLPPVEDIDD